MSTEFGLGLIIGLGAICLYAFITENQALKTVIILVVGLKYAIRAYNPMVKIVLSAWLWCHGKNPMEYEFRASSNWGAGEQKKENFFTKVVCGQEQYFKIA